MLAGRHYDEKGNLREWWSDEASGEYLRKAECLTNQYSNYTVLGHPVSQPLPTFDCPLHHCAQVNGHKTCSENIADNVGLKLAYKVQYATTNSDLLRKFST
jgi:membrane metallo-endopeptidase-like protein 1